MSGPWEKFQQPDVGDEGPWAKFQAASAPVEAKKQGQSATTSQRVQALGAGVNRGFVSDILGLPVDTAANVLDLGKAGIGYLTSKVTGTAPPSWTMPMDRSEVVGSGEWIAKKIDNASKAIGVQSPVTPVRPDDAASRILFTGGRGIGGTISPNPRAKISGGVQLTNAVMGGLSGLANGATAEVAPEWAGLVGMLPSAAIAAGSSGIKYGVRGNEAGRQAMEQRIQDLQNGGIESPSVGLASGNRTIMGLENLLAQTPFSSGLYADAGKANLAGMKGKTEALRDSISTDFGPVAAGQAIQADLKGALRDRIKTTGGKLSERVADQVGRDTVVPVAATLERAEKLSTPTKGAEATTKKLINPRIADIATNLRTDVYGALPVSARPLDGNPTLRAALTPEVPQTVVNNSSLWNVPTAPHTPMDQLAQLPFRRIPVEIDSMTNLPKASKPLPPMAQREGPNPTLNLPTTRAVEQDIVANPSLWNTPTALHDPLPQRVQNIAKQDIPNAGLWNAQKEKGIPFGALKSLRTSIGEEAASNAIMGTPEQAQFKQLYGAMSDDMRNAAALSDARRGIDPNSTGSATAALNRSNKFYSRAMNRAEELNGLANRDTPEGAYNAVTNSLNSGPSIYEKLRSTLNPETRQKIVATVIDQLGTAKPGQQGAAGDEWSPRTFLTNFAKLHENGGGDALFKRLPGGQKHAEQLADIAKASEMVGDASKVWANPSGTAAALSARGTVATLSVGALLNPLMAASTAGGLVSANQLSQRLLLNPKFVNWLAKAPNVPRDQATAYAQRLMSTALLTKDPQFKQDVSDYLELSKDNEK